MLPVELLKGDESTNVETVSKFLERTQEVWRSARAQMEKAVVAQKRYYDQKHRDIQFAVGDTVLLSTQNLRLKGIPHKLQRKFCGPYKILEKIGAQAYRLKLPDTWRIHPVFHVSLLKQWRPSTVQQVPREVELEDADQPQYFDVEKILRWRWTSKTPRRQREFLVLWQGYPVEEAEWIPASYFTDQDALRAAIEANRIPKSNEAILVSVDRNSSLGGSSCGKSWCWLGVAMGAGWHRCSISTNEPFWRGLVAAALGGLPSEYQ